MQKPLLLIPLACILLISGCTVPGLGIQIPFLPDLFGPPTVEYENDIVVIRNLQAIPAITVKSGQPLTLYADIENLDRPEKNPLTAVSVELFDYCVNLFTIEPRCPAGDGTITTTEGCNFTQFFPKEIKTVSWILTPKDIDLEQQCELKVRVRYPYTTNAVTQISFIDAAELSNRIRRGEPYHISGFEARSEGPVKPYLHVESQQPVSDDSVGQISLQAKNVGFGFVQGSQLAQDAVVAHDKVELDLLPDGGDCRLNATQRKLINKETPPIFCRASYDVPPEIAETTFNLEASVTYAYEFRKSLVVKVVPKETPL